jgi:hypothetical protein
MAKRIAGVKTGRRAGKNEREKARRLVAVYYRARASPDGRLCLNPNDDLSEQTFIDALNPNLLIWALENFAQHGTFHFMDQVVSQNIDDALHLRKEFEGLRSNGETYQHAVETLTQSHNMSKSTVERKIKIKPIDGPLTKLKAYLQTVPPIEAD